MPKKRTPSAPVPPERCFVKELAGETPPSFQTMERLYRLASDLYGLRPWRILEEDNLIVIHDSGSGELCYCSVMGALGVCRELRVSRHRFERGCRWKRAIRSSGRRLLEPCPIR